MKTVSAETWKYGILDAGDKARRAADEATGPDECLEWEDWTRAQHTLQIHAARDGYRPIVDAMVSTFRQGRERDTFVTTLAAHLHNRTWG